MTGFPSAHSRFSFVRSDVLNNVLFVFITCFDASVLCRLIVIMSMFLIRSSVLKEQLSAQILVWFLLGNRNVGFGFGLVGLSGTEGNGDRRNRLKQLVCMYWSVRYEGCS